MVIPVLSPWCKGANRCYLQQKKHKILDRIAVAVTYIHFYLLWPGQARRRARDSENGVLKTTKFVFIYMNFICKLMLGRGEIPCYTLGGAGKPETAFAACCLLDRRLYTDLSALQYVYSCKMV